ncbi:MFS transporter [Halobacillus salinus]|uniref:MFS transporter n=1 Tax=Halobacillus salinus TaxID=192814 RepID=A0A4Z0H1N9_9BACI|nr:MFS transporter [Halobacillus salinus]TGB03777.1 MFS transporter [Halobacillus salinus]
MENKVSRWCIVSMASVPLVMTLGNSMLIPVLPIFEKKIGITSFQSSMIITSYSLAAILLIPIAGYLSDRIGRKIVILPSLILALIGGAIAGWASWKIDDPYMWVIIGRVLQGVGAAGAMPILLPLVGDLYKDDDQKASSCLGIIETSNTFGKVLSPILGAGFAAILWFLPFFSISFFSLISIALVFFFIKVPKGSKQDPVPFRAFLKKTKELMKKEGKWLLPVFLLGLFAMLLLFAVLFFMSDFLEKFHDIKGVKKGFVLAIPLFVLCSFSFLTGRFIKGDKAKMKKIIVFALVLASAMVVFVGFFKESLWLWLLITSLLGLGIGAMLPCLDALITEGIEKEERGTITSFYSSCRFIGVAFGPPIISILMKNHLNITFIASGVLGGLLAILTIILVKE